MSLVLTEKDLSEDYVLDLNERTDIVDLVVEVDGLIKASPAKVTIKGSGLLKTIEAADERVELCIVDPLEHLESIVCFQLANKKFPMILTKCKNLKHLEWMCPEFSEFPAELVNLPNLETFITEFTLATFPLGLRKTWPMNSMVNATDKLYVKTKLMLKDLNQRKIVSCVGGNLDIQGSYGEDGQLALID